MNHDITPFLETKEKFLPLLDHFVQRSIAETDEKYIDDPSPVSYAAFYSSFLPIVAQRNAEHIYAYSESPIERIFLASLQLLFIKSSMPCLHISEPARDAQAYMQYYRQTHHDINRMIANYKQITGDTALHNFHEALAKKQQSGEFTEEQVNEIKAHESIVPNFEWNSYHLIPQAGLPQIKVEGRSIRVDLLIWVPGDESIKVVVECDGYAYHSSKESFQNDRARDRVLQLNGYRVIRFSGAEINRDPALIGSQLFDLLEVIDEDKEEKRVL
jgi:hypothetical protein